MEAKVGQLVFEHHFNDSLRVTTTARYLDNDRYQAYHESREWVDVNGDGQANVLDGTPANYRFSRQNRAGDKAECYGLYLQDLGEHPSNPSLAAQRTSL